MKTFSYTNNDDIHNIIERTEGETVAYKYQNPDYYCRLERDGDDYILKYKHGCGEGEFKIPGSVYFNLIPLALCRNTFTPDFGTISIQEYKPLITAKGADYAK